MSNSTLTVFESFEFADLYAGLRTLPSVFASKILACPDFDANVNKAAIKETWDFFWENAGGFVLGIFKAL